MSDLLNLLYGIEFYYLDGVLTTDHIFHVEDGDIDKFISISRDTFLTYLGKFIIEKHSSHVYKVKLKTDMGIDVIAHWDFYGTFSSDFNHVLVYTSSDDKGKEHYTYFDSEPLYRGWCFEEAKRLLRLPNEKLKNYTKDYFQKYAVETYRSNKKDFYRWSEDDVEEKLKLCR